MEWAILAALEAKTPVPSCNWHAAGVFSRREVVFHGGDPADTLHLISKGRFGVRMGTPQGDTAVVSVLGPGEFFGELALLGESARSATVYALEPGETRALHKIDFEGLRTRHPATTDVLAEVLAAQVRRLSKLLLDALYLSADVRVQRRLAEVATQYSSGDAPAVVPLTQEELAELAGTSRATVNRVLREAQRRGDVELLRGQVKVLDPKRSFRAGCADPF